MPKYYAVKFKKEIPVIPGVTLGSAFDGYNFISVDDGIDYFHIEDYPYVELTEAEITHGSKYYGECRPYRSAYSDVEGLTPDPDELAKGKRKTKVYHTDESLASTVSLMKKITKRMVSDVFDERDNRDGEDALHAEIDACQDVKAICLFKESKFGQEMPFPLAREFNLIDENNQRINPPIHRVNF